MIATDPAPSAETNLRQYLDAAWPTLTAMGLAKNASRDRLSFTLDMREAVSDADLVVCCQILYRRGVNNFQIETCAMLRGDSECYNS